MTLFYCKTGKFSTPFCTLLVALVSVVGFTVPIVWKAITPDDSIINVKYLDRSDVSFPLIVTNDGDRPAVFEPGAGLKMEFINNQGVKTEHGLMLGLDGVTRDGLVIPAKSNKLFYFFVRPNQGFDYIFPNMEKDWDRKKGGLRNLKKSRLLGSFINFQGGEGKYEITVFDANRPPKLFGDRVMDEIYNADGISIKIPIIEDRKKQ